MSIITSTLGVSSVVGVGVIAGLEGLTSRINTVWCEITLPRPAGYNSGDSLWVPSFGWSASHDMADKDLPLSLDFHLHLEIPQPPKIQPAVASDGPSCCP